MQGQGDAATAVESLSFVSVRFTTFMSIVVVVGAAAFLALVVTRLEERGAREVAREMRARLRVLGLGASLALLALAVARLALQRQMLSEAMGTSISLETMMSGAWGTGMALQCIGAIAGLVSFGTRLTTRASALARGVALVMVVSPALSGHAAGEEHATLPIIADAFHVLGAGAWAGLVMALAVVALPVAITRGRRDAAPIVREVLSAFSPVAIGGAALLAITGFYASWLHLTGWASLGSTRYGQALVWKLAGVVVMLVLGGVNKLVMTPAVVRPNGVSRLRRVVWIELAVAVLILVITAVLVGRPTPADM